MQISMTVDQPRKTDDSNKDKDEQIEDVNPKKEPKGLKLTAIPDRREGVLNDTAESVIASIYS